MLSKQLAPFCHSVVHVCEDYVDPLEHEVTHGKVTDCNLANVTVKKLIVKSMTLRAVFWI